MLEHLVLEMVIEVMGYELWVVCPQSQPVITP